MKVTISVEVEVTSLPDGRFNALVTVPVSPDYERVQPVFPFAVDEQGYPKLHGEGAGHTVLCDLLQAAIVAAGSNRPPSA